MSSRLLSKGHYTQDSEMVQSLLFTAGYVIDSRPMMQQTAVQQWVVEAKDAGQRLDNYLFKHFPQIPKSRWYRAFRTGEVRVNKKRVAAPYRIVAADIIRLPPLSLPESPVRLTPSAMVCKQVNERILYEDETLLVLNKPAGLACHGGTGVDYGVIEVIQQRDPAWQLVHRLDKATSGCLLFAKDRETLLSLHAQLTSGGIEKYYLALTANPWEKDKVTINAPLLKQHECVVVSDEGKSACTHVMVLKPVGDYTLIKAQLVTGRTHQLRVHLAHIGHPIVGDDRYGDHAVNKVAAAQGLRRLYLHAWHLSFMHRGRPVSFEAVPDSAFGLE